MQNEIPTSCALLDHAYEVSKKLHQTVIMTANT